MKHLESVTRRQYQNNQKPGIHMGGQHQQQQIRQQGPNQPFSQQPYQSQGYQNQQRQPPTILPPAPLKSALKKPEVKDAPQQQQQQANRAPQQQQQQQQQQAANRPPQQQQQQQQQSPQQQQQQQPQVQQQPSPQQTQPSEQQEQQQEISPLKMETKSDENGEVKKKTLLIKGKISKKEKRGRRNKRLRKILMPKNALMILNELCAGHKFTFIEKDAPNPTSPYYIDGDTYVASVTIDGVEHVGYAKSKIAAKTAAAENALRHIVLSKIGTQKPPSQTESESEGDSKMELDGEAQDEEEVSWLHVANFAIHKLFSTWYSDEDNKMEQSKLLANATGIPDFASQMKDAKTALLATVNKGGKQRRPAKQLPNNPQLLNPVMLLNQMRDDVVYEEVAKEGNPPNVIFTYRTVVEGWEFFGKGSNKKIARRNCAYAACSKIYELSYTVEEFDPSTTFYNLLGNQGTEMNNQHETMTCN